MKTRELTLQEQSRAGGPPDSPSSSSRHRGRPQERRGFTLIELLVVISIIVLLIAILLPVLTTARQTGKSAACMSNLRQIGIAFQNYVVDYKGQLMPVTHLPTAIEGPWYRRLATNSNVSYHRPTSYLAGDDAMFCPSHEIPPTGDPVNFPDSRDWAYDRGTISYGMSFGLHQDYDNGGVLLVARIDDIRDPTRTLEVTDAAIMNTQPGNFYLHPYYSTSPFAGSPALRHFGGSNVLWVDGHVTAIRPPLPGDVESMYSQEALTSHSATNLNYWDRD